MNKKKEPPKSIGTVTLGTATDEPREVEIEDMLRIEYQDHRLVSIARTEEDAYLFCIENPASTGRATQQTMYLTEGSAIALFSTYMAYLEHHGFDAGELLKKYIQEKDQLSYEFSQR